MLTGTSIVSPLDNHFIGLTQLFELISQHWHGLFQRGTNWADGPAFVTQCPITSGESFLYNYRVPDQAGEF